MRVAIFGAGAIGGLVGAVLHRAGADVGVLARGGHLEAIRRDGLSLTADGQTETYKLRATASPEELGPQDLVIVAVKAPSLPAVAASISPLLGPDTAVAFLMNGIPWWYFHGHGGRDEGRRIPLADPGGTIWDAIGPDRVIGGVVCCACTAYAPGRIQLVGAMRRIQLGRPDGRVDPVVRELADLLGTGGIDAQVVPEIRDAIWNKLVSNLMDGPIAMLTGTRSNVIFAEEGCRTIARAIGREGIALGRMMGRQIDLDIEQAIELGQRRPHLPSIAEDLQRGRPMEVDTLINIPMAFAAERGVAMPTLDAIAAMAKLRTRAMGAHGSEDTVAKPT